MQLLMRRAAPRHNLAQRGLRRRYARGRRAPSLLLLKKVSCVWREHAQVPWQLDGGSSTSTTACGEQSRAGCAKLRLLRRRWVPLLGCLAWHMAEQGRRVALQRRGGWSTLRVEHHSRRPNKPAGTNSVLPRSAAVEDANGNHKSSTRL